MKKVKQKKMINQLMSAGKYFQTTKSKEELRQYVEEHVVMNILLISILAEIWRDFYAEDCFFEEFIEFSPFSKKKLFTNMIDLVKGDMYSVDELIGVFNKD